MDLIIKALGSNAGPIATFATGPALEWLRYVRERSCSNALREFNNLEFCCNYSIKDPRSGAISTIPEDIKLERIKNLPRCHSDYEIKIYSGNYINCLFYQSRKAKAVVFIMVWPPGGPPDGGDSTSLTEEVFRRIFDENDILCLSPGRHGRTSSDICVVVMRTLFQSVSHTLLVQDESFYAGADMNWSEIEWNDLRPRFQVYVAMKLKRGIGRIGLEGILVNGALVGTIDRAIGEERRFCEGDLDDPFKSLAHIIDGDISNLLWIWLLRVNIEYETSDFSGRNNNAEMVEFVQNDPFNPGGIFLERWYFFTPKHKKADTGNPQAEWVDLPKSEPSSDGFCLAINDLGTVSNDSILGNKLSDQGKLAEAGELNHRVDAKGVVDHNELGSTANFGDRVTANIRLASMEKSGINDVSYDVYSGRWPDCAEIEKTTPQARGRYALISGPKANREVGQRDGIHDEMGAWFDVFEQGQNDAKPSGKGRTESSAVRDTHREFINGTRFNPWAIMRTNLGRRDGPYNNHPNG